MFVFGPEDFLKVAETGKVAPLICERDIGRATPTSAYLALGGGPNSFLLESAGGSASLTEYSFVGVDPLKIIETSGSNPLPLLRLAVSTLSPACPAGGPGQIEMGLPFWGGAVGYLAYDVARYLEKLPTLTEDGLKLPESVFIFPRVLLVFDHRADRLFVCINQLIGTNKRQSLVEAQRRMADVLERLGSDVVIAREAHAADRGNLLSRDCFPRLVHSQVGVAMTKRKSDAMTKRKGDVKANLTRKQFETIVRRAKEYIYAGDIFQSNLSVRFDLPFDGDSFALYLTLREINPSPFAAYLDLGHFQLVSCSPERLIRLRDRVADTRPIAGTRRRGDTEMEDETLSANLLLDEKERAEHIMLVDLERNDLGRVCEYGTVLPSELFTVEKYSHVIHIVSNVRGRLAPGKDQFDLARTMFPGGTITGCPKVRCMQIIEELEPTRRSVYTGSIGYFGFNGNMDMNIAIRTFIVKDGRAFVQAGSGVVADSDPSREYFEAVSKANALLKALGVEEERTRWERLPM